jgi:hypothetical protein
MPEQISTHIQTQQVDDAGSHNCATPILICSDAVRMDISLKRVAITQSKFLSTFSIHGIEILKVKYVQRSSKLQSVLIENLDF